MISSTCGEKRAITQDTIGFPCSSCRPLSTLPMRRPWPPARTMPLTWLMKTDFTSKLRAMNRNRFLVPFLNLGHFLDHLVMLVFPTVVIALFFFGIGGALFLTGFARSTWQIGVGLALTGMFAAIYHPVGIAMLVAAPAKLGSALGWNGLWGNLGLAAAAIVSGALMDLWGWRAAFFVPGLLSIAAGTAYLALVPDPGPVQKRSSSIGLNLDRRTMARIFVILLVATSCGGVIFNSTTIAMPKVFEERLQALTQTNLGIGALVAFVYTLAAFAQLAMGSLID